MSIFDGKIDNKDARYVVTGNECELRTNSNLKSCISVHYEIQDLKPSPEVLLPDPDYGYLAEIWGLAFTSVLFLWLFSHGIGQILKMVKNG